MAMKNMLEFAFGEETLVTFRITTC